jgi:predicted O-linked N-acetylglucosamine transferase (SPINDLY family)
MAKRSFKNKAKKPNGIATVSMTLENAEKNAKKQPSDPKAWRMLGVIYLRKGQLNNAIANLEKSKQLDPEDIDTLAWLGYTSSRLGDQLQARKYLDKDPQHLQALIGLGALEFDIGNYSLALDVLKRAESLNSDNLELLEYKAHVLLKMSRYEEGLDVYHQLIGLKPDSFKYWNGAGTAYRDLGDFEKLVTYYEKAIKLAKNNPVPFANLLTSVHYSPDWSGEEVAALCKEWQVRYGPKNPPARPIPSNLSPQKTLRIGMFSDGLRSHPVGNMIIEAVERLHPNEVELYCYPTHSDEDHLTKRFKKVAAKWKPVKHLPMDAFAQQVREDEIDILIDMSGHNSGSRSLSVALQPAPLIIKWVGGLINTTGIEAMDYLLSDSMETLPQDEVDDMYVEKLVRLPDDYIVYHIPSHAPPVAKLPAHENDYITLGCFNNPTKLNDTTLSEWAKLMHKLPESRLFLKNKPYTSEALCERIYTKMEQEGIVRERVLIEGPAPHLKLLEAYSKVDIALDPWPYSGGLTTCEALLMGVPVVTLPGPTFAGRHSATHLVNAGLPELVVESWENYHERVIELASDLDSLATIRQHLREILKQSPVCDGARFAKHLMITFRAVWQRYCEGKAPEALTFNKEGRAWFKGEADPVDVVVTEVESSNKATGFNWEFQGQIVTIDNACKILRNRALSLIVQSRAFAIIAFDPQSLVQKPEVFSSSENIQLFQHALLGDGQPATLHACMAPTLSSTLKPLAEGQLPPSKRDGANVLTTLPINTIALDNIKGLGGLDWLVLDSLSDASTILAHGEETLKNTLLIEVRVVFQSTHERQPSLPELQHWASRNGFRFYRLNTPRYLSHFPDTVPTNKRQATELESADAIFLPSHERMAELADNQRIKLAFLLHTIYGIRDMSYELLAAVDEEKAEEYLIAEGVVEDATKEVPAVEAPESSAAEKPETPAIEVQDFPLPEAPFMSPAERSLFKRGLKKAKHYFEFGSGGSTVWAVKEGLTVKGVESDAKWVNALKNKLGEKCEVEAVDIGPTKEWGFPVSIQQASRFPAYSKAIHCHTQGFDFILVDGRFRVACAMAAIQHVLEHSKEPQEARIFIHDFWNRPQYHVVLEFLDVVEKAETAGVFKLKTDLKAEVISVTWKKFSLQPN